MDKFKSFESFDSGSNYQFGDKMLNQQSPSSLFDLSHTVTTTIPHEGMLLPLTLFEALPGDDHEITADALVRVLPQVVPLYSRQRLKLYAFYSRYSDLWSNWQVFMDKGYTGNVNKQIPHLGSDNVHVASESTTTVKADSLPDFLGLPIGSSISALQSANISALPFMMYLRIYRDYFMNKNEWINNRILLPDDDSRFRLGDDGNLLSASDLSKLYKFSFDTNDFTTDESGNMSNGILYHEWQDDYFTTALPFTQRGTTPSLEYSVDLSKIGLNFGSSFVGDVPLDEDGTRVYDTGDNKPILYLKKDPSEPQTDMNWAIRGGTLQASYNSIYARDDVNAGLLQALNRGKLTGTNIGLNITLEDIRRLAERQQELEALARTDGSYAQFGLTFFGEISKSAVDYRPIYIGGAYKNIVFTEVLQTNSTSVDSATSSNSPLGSYAGHGITGITDNYIGRIHCDDYGLIMILACIMPDTYYSQGLDRLWTDSLQEEKYLPERAKLGLQPIYNKEIYYAGNNSSSEGGDDYLWAYQNPFDYLRYMPNKIKGKIADSTALSFFPYTQSRYFTQLPNWGHEFSVADDTNVRSDYLFADTEDHYTAQFSFNIRTVRKLPYKPIPAQII